MNHKKINEKHGVESNSAMVVFGNKKLPISHAIVNMCSATFCPSAERGLCGVTSKCYAQAEEAFRPMILQCNMNRLDAYNKLNDIEWVEMIMDYIKMQHEYVNDVEAIRINEAGDFIDQACIDRINLLAESAMKQYGIRTYAWTSRSDLDFSGRRFVLNASTPKVNSYDRLFLAKPKEWIDNHTLENGEAICAGHCKGCDICNKHNGIKTVYVEYHGPRKNK